MAMKSNNYFFLLPRAIFFLSLFLSLASAHNKSHDESSSAALGSSYKGYFSKVCAFGDSYTDTGNAHFMGGLTASSQSKEYGSSYGAAGSRLSNGRLVVDFLSEALSLPPLPPFQNSSCDFSHGVNFAVAGSTALSSEYFIRGQLGTLIWKKTPLNFETQIDWFKKFQLQIGCTTKGGNETHCKAEMENTLFWIGEMAVNDYSRTIGSSISLRWLADRSVTHISRLVKELILSGAKYIIVEGLPPIGCLPIAVSQCRSSDHDKMGCSSIANTAITIHNQILQRKLDRFRKTYPHCSILYADYWNAYLTILTNPAKHQFQETFKACCGTGGGQLNFNKDSLCGSPGTSTCKDPSKYISWDGIHLTEAMNQQLVNLFLNQGFCQPSFHDLIKSKSGI